VIDPLRRSLLVRLSLGFALTLSGLVGASGLFLYSSIEHIVYTQINRDFINTAKLLLHKLDDDRLPLDKEILDVGEHFSVRVTDLAPKVLLETHGMDKKFPMLCAPPDQRDWIWTHGPATPEHSPRSLRVRYHQGWVQLSRDLKPEESLLREFFQSMLALLAIAPFIGGAFGYWLVKMALKPLRYLEDEAENLRPGNLGIRIDSHRLPTELAPLSQALNHSIARLESAFARLSELNSDVAHELRTPVHSLRLEAEHILASGNLPETAEEQLAGMMDTLDHMAALIEQMLFLARSEDPAHQVEMVPLDVENLLATAREPFVSLAEESQISVEISAPGGLFVRGNATLLRRALHNLLANAIRHSPQGSTVSLEAGSAPGSLTLAVRDRGEGIPKQFLANLGQRFVRTDASRSRKRGGAGLGLAIVNGIAKLHGAALCIESEEGVGTVAKITFRET
jgi:two-component system heavy metal sensor histidine kinase CusS